MGIAKQYKTCFIFLLAGIIALFPACQSQPGPTWIIDVASESPSEVTGNPATEVIVYASELTDLFELEFYDDSLSPAGKYIGLPNNGDELDPPPENDPYVAFRAVVQSGIPYRCWIHMKVGSPKGVSQANVIWVQFSDSVNQAGEEVLRAGTDDYLTAQGSEKQGWQWVGCDATGIGSSNSDSLVYFRLKGEVSVRLQAGAEGVGFDQFLLSPAEFLITPPINHIIER